ncbi:serine/threonine protein kinase [Marinitenerispora sediminis]|uniref:Serine/threonine protein kinase n=2 Tax=Marinitenerispora sediminis TaxID=1931232 RepID=A0A368T0D9_9ACTN|nr:serine/threonine protein kinase [Marinitenerispora sediminis]RCV51070.1 serine/threonine protein kinase [Marinitenerispora sediminis]RCV52350.1 serine/threonine protein kinase [Marinitenerispora sediminis]
MSSSVDPQSPSPQLPSGFSPLTPDDPRVIGPFRIVGRVGAGGMGAVFGALDDAGRQVAVKVIHPRHAADAEYRRQFAREADLVRRVDAECAPAFLGADPAAEQPWLATEFVRGQTLKEHVAEDGPLTGAALLSFAAGTAEALAAIHAAGVLHRDIKPGNVMLSAEGPRVLDFGIARAAGDDEAEHAVYGTPGWIAPERLDGAAATPRSDVFAWGGLVVYAATGRAPFGSGEARTLLARSREGTPDLDGVPDELRPLVARALDPDPANRPEAAEVLDAVLDLAGVEPAEAGADQRSRLRALLRASWLGFGTVGRGAGPWIAVIALGAAAVPNAGAVAGAGAAGGLAAGGAAGAAGGAAGAAGGAAGAAGGAAGGAAAGGASAAAATGTIAGMSKATALIVAGATATAVVTGGWIGGRVYAGEPILPFGAAAEETPAPRDGTPVEFRGLTMWLPDGWQAERIEDEFGPLSAPDPRVTEEWLVLYPGGQEGCADVDWMWADTNVPSCEHVRVFGPGGIAFGGPGYGPITAEEDPAPQFIPASEVPGCPEGRSVYTEDDPRHGAEVAETRPVGDQQAAYREVTVPCSQWEDPTDWSSPVNTRYYDQRWWLLPDSEIFILDGYGIEALDGILADAEVRRAERPATQPVRFRNLTFEVPGEWEVVRNEGEFQPLDQAAASDDWLLIATDPGRPCSAAESWNSHHGCPSIMLFGPGGISTGYAMSAVNESRPYHPAAEPYTCDPSYDTSAPEPAESLTPQEAGLADVGDRRAFYRVWYVGCTDAPGDRVSTDGPTVFYEQRYWLLPESQILVVDNHRTEGLAGMLAAGEVTA